METIDKNNLPNFVSNAAALAADEIAIHYDLMGGTKTVREKGALYMPKLPLESDGGWNTKVQAATLYNKYKSTINTMVGLVLRREPKIGEDGAEGFRQTFTKHWENITSDGMHGKVFLQNALKNQFAGCVFIVVDYPAKDENIKDKVDEMNAAGAPTGRFNTANQAINWQFGLVDNKTVLTQITFKEIQIEPKGRFGEEEAVYYRNWHLKEFSLQGVKIYRAVWELFKEVRNEGEISYPSQGGGTTKLSRLPVAIAGTLPAKPPLIDLAYVNIRHYQDYADYRKGKAIAGLAFLWAKGLKETDQAIGWDVMFKLDGDKNSDAGMGFVEASGAALEAHRFALQDTKQEMSELGMSLLVEKAPQTMTATQAIIDHTQSSSALLEIADSLHDACEVAAEIHGAYLDYKKEEVSSIDLGYKPEELVLTPQNVDLLFLLYDKGLVTGETLLSCFKTGGSLPDSLDVEEEIREARSEYETRRKSLADSQGRGIEKAGKLPAE